MAAPVRAGPVALATQLMDGNRILDNRETVPVTINKGEMKMKMNEKDKALEALRLLAAQCGNAKVRSENLKIVKDYVEERHEREAALLRNAEAEDMEEEMQNDK